MRNYHLVVIFSLYTLIYLRARYQYYITMTRTIDEIEKRITWCKKQMSSSTSQDEYVITTGSMTVNKNPRGRYELYAAEYPSKFSRSQAYSRQATMQSKNELLKFEVITYKDWLQRELNKMLGLANIDSKGTRNTERNTDSDSSQRGETNSTTSTTSATSTTSTTSTNSPDTTSTHEEDTNYSTCTNIRVYNPSCPIGCNNCTCCIYLKHISIIDDRNISIECSNNIDR